MPIVIPTHQGRAAEEDFVSILGGKGKYIVSNTLFDQLGPIWSFCGAEGVDLLCGRREASKYSFKFWEGNLDTIALKKL